MVAAATIPRPRETRAEYSETVRWILLVAVMLGTLLEVLDITIINVAIPDMMGNLGATLDQISWVSTGYMIANVIFLPLTGWLSSLLGRRRYLTGSILLFTLASLFCGLSTSLNALIFFRILQGAGGAALLSTAQATILEVFPESRHGLVLGLFGIGVMVGPTIGPALGGWITDNYSWPWIFFINLPIGALAATLTWLFMRDTGSRPPARRRVDFAGIGLLAVGIGSLQTLIECGSREDWFESGLIRWLALLAAVGLFLFVLWELRTPEPAVDLRVLRHRGLTAGTLFAVVLGFGLYGSAFMVPVFLQELRHFTAAQAGAILFPGGLAMAVAIAATGKAVTRLAPRSMVAAGALAMSGAMLLLRANTLDTGPEHLLGPLVLRGAAFGLLWVPLSLAALDGLQGQDLAAGVGLFNLTRQLGGSFGIALLSTLFDHRTAAHRAALVEHVTAYDPATSERLHTLTVGLMTRGSLPGVAREQAVALLDRAVQCQAAVLAFSDLFLVLGLAFLAALPLLLLFKNRKPAATAHLFAPRRSADERLTAETQRAQRMRRGKSMGTADERRSTQIGRI